MTRWVPLAMLGLAACGGARTHAAVGAPTAPTAAAVASAAAPKLAPSPLFPERPHGWDKLDPKARAAIAAFAGDYLGFLAAKTPRRAIAALTALAEAAGTTRLGATPSAHAAGTRFDFVAPGGDAAALVRVGTRPLTDGVRLLIASVDAPRIDLKEQPVYVQSGLALLDTYVYGELDAKTWLTHPVALYLHLAKPGATDLDLAIGEADDDPVLVIPDLLPHLMRRVQVPEIVDSDERLDAVGATTPAALATALAARGVTVADLASAEAYLIPAGPAIAVGVDRALIGGYGQGRRALAYAAVRAWLAAAGDTTSIVVLVGKTEIGGTGSTGLGFVATALGRMVGELGGDLDELDRRRMIGASHALWAGTVGGKRGQGVVVSPRSDDALPRGLRDALDRFDRAGAQVQLVDDAGGGFGPALGELDLEVVEVGLPVTGGGTPEELLSSLDLYEAWLALRGWLGDA